MGVLAALRGADLRAVVTTYRDVLRIHQEELNRLNVYPVPDGDTGTNMALTLESVCAEMDGTEVGDADRLAGICRAVAHGSLMGARGNSGVILSQILRGMTSVFEGAEVIDGPRLVAALRRGCDTAYEAVVRPVEGTILTVVRRAAEAAEVTRDAGADTLMDVLSRAGEAADDAVVRTPELLPVLAAAGVVDAGGRGFALMLDAFLYVAGGRPVPKAPLSKDRVLARPPAVVAHEHGGDVAALRYEVMFLLHAEDTLIPAFKHAWGAIGDSIVVVGGDGLWNCHVHTNDIGAAIEAGVEAGRPARVQVTDLFEQVAEEEQWVRDARRGDASTPALVTTGVVAVGVGDGVMRLLRSVGVQAVVAGGQSMNPSTAQILEAVESIRAEGVIVLPNNKNIVPVANQVDALTDCSVAVVPTHAVVEALSALVEYDPDAPLEVNLAAMTRAAQRVRAGEVTRAVRDSTAECGPIAEGDWIAITRDGIRVVAETVADAVITLLDELIDDQSELVTLVVGMEAHATDIDHVCEHLDLEHPKVEVEVHAGDQPMYPFLLGVE